MPKSIKPRVRANRQNAKHSTGPRTPEGKAQSRQNALKHGLLAESVVVPNCDQLESQEQFDELLTDLSNEYKPVGPIEKLLVETIAVSYWRLRRALRYEAAQIAVRVKNLNRWDTGDPLGSASLPTVDRTHMILRYETIIERRLNRATIRLEHLQNKRRTKRRDSHGVAASNSPVAHLSGGFPSDIQSPQKGRPQLAVGSSDTQPNPTYAHDDRDLSNAFWSENPHENDKKPNEPNSPQSDAPYSDTPVYPFPKTTPAGYPSFQPYKQPEKKMPTK